jgi:hypothetical protein
MKPRLSTIGPAVPACRIALLQIATKEIFLSAVLPPIRDISGNSPNRPLTAELVEKVGSAGIC